MFLIYSFRISLVLFPLLSHALYYMKDVIILLNFLALAFKFIYDKGRISSLLRLSTISLQTRNIKVICQCSFLLMYVIN